MNKKRSYYTSLDILGVINDYIQREGWPPTHRELVQVTDLQSTGAVHHHLSTLIKDGLIYRKAGSSRAYRITRKGRRALREYTAGTRSS